MSIARHIRITTNALNYLISGVQTKPQLDIHAALRRLSVPGIVWCGGGVPSVASQVLPRGRQIPRRCVQTWIQTPLQTSQGLIDECIRFLLVIYMNRCTKLTNYMSFKYIE